MDPHPRVRGEPVRDHAVKFVHLRLRSGSPAGISGSRVIIISDEEPGVYEVQLDRARTVEALLAEVARPDSNLGTTTLAWQVGKHDFTVLDNALIPR